MAREIADPTNVSNRTYWTAKPCYVDFLESLYPYTNTIYTDYWSVLDAPSIMQIFVAFLLHVCTKPNRFTRLDKYLCAEGGLKRRKGWAFFRILA